jgi:hypothetical protein
MDVVKPFLIATSAILAIAVSTPLWAADGRRPAAIRRRSAGAAQSANRMPAAGRVTSERGLTGPVERAHHRRHATYHASQAQSQGVANQLNQQESKIQSGNQPPGGNPTTLNRMPIGGKATSGSNKF